MYVHHVAPLNNKNYSFSIPLKNKPIGLLKKVHESELEYVYLSRQGYAGDVILNF
jgi:hypothetical protein